MNYQDILKELEQFNDVFVDASYTEAIDVICNHFRTYPDASIIGLAAGRMGYSLRAFIMRLGHIGLPATMLGDTCVPVCSPSTLCIISSSSGNTPSLILHAKQARAFGARVLLFTANPYGKLSDYADAKFMYGQVESMQVMKTVYEQFTYLLFDLMADDIRRRFGVHPNFMESNHSILE